MYEEGRAISPGSGGDAANSACHTVWAVLDSIVQAIGTFQAIETTSSSRERVRNVRREWCDVSVLAAAPMLKTSPSLSSSAACMFLLSWQSRLAGLNSMRLKSTSDTIAGTHAVARSGHVYQSLHKSNCSAPYIRAVQLAIQIVTHLQGATQYHQ